ncbi:MAG: [protein-PII] uridylyltransferase [Gallionellaceae bacterium]
MQTTPQIRDALRAARLTLQQDYLTHSQPHRLLHNHAKLIDHYLQLIWHQSGMPDDAAFIAAGGYGREELFPKSDIDILILLNEQPDDALQQRLQALVGVLWDIGLEIGHSIRTVSECIAESSDLTVQTNLLEARHITGNHALFFEMREALIKILDRRDFFLAKTDEQQKRHTRFIDTDFNLEPNLKESPGGLRDLQTVFWISRACGFGTTWKELANAGLITPSEARAIARHEALLQTLRIRLHYLANRREDRLLFDYQTALAEQMDIHASTTRRASEHLMQHYYRTKQAVLQLSSVLLQNMRARIFPEANVTYPINERFIARDDFLEARDEEIFNHQPTSILESFLLLQRYPELKGFSASTMRALWRSRKNINAAFRKDPNNRDLFMQIFREPQGLTHALRRMNQHGILERYLPAFGRVVGQMQHDLFHVYTVDEHIMMVVRNLRRFTLAKHAPENPLCSKLIKDFARPEVLYVAGLFHDIAKGRGGDHSKLGRADASRFCKQHALSREDTELVVWLVEQHLSMSSTAQKQDLSDQDVIATFSAQVKNDRYLTALYLLTVADIRGTSAKVWNAWKGKLLEDLFHASRRFMVDGKIADQIGEIRQRAQETLSLYAVAPDVYALLWAQLDAEYFLRHEPHEIAWHTRQLAHRVNSATPIVRARLSRIGEGTQVMVYSPDQPYLFARICSFFERMNYSIMEAKIHTTQHGYALDSFLVMNASNDKTEYRDVMNYIEYELAQLLTQKDAPPTPQVGRVNRQLKHFPIKPEVDIRDDEKGGYILSLIAGDRPGLLARIAYFLAQHHIELHRAKVNTLGSRAEDSFWINAKNLDVTAHRENLSDLLKSQLT